jgi:hypothetical protein
MVSPSLGLTPALACGVAVLLGILAIGLRQLSRLGQAMENSRYEFGQVCSRVQQIRQDLFRTPPGRAMADNSVLEKLDRLHTAWQRQDEKLINLNKASKMYAKPILELSSQVRGVADIASAIEAKLNEFAKRQADEDEAAETEAEVGEPPYITELRQGLTSLGHSLEGALDQHFTKVSTSLDREPEDPAAMESLLAVMGRLQERVEALGAKLDSMAAEVRTTVSSATVPMPVACPNPAATPRLNIEPTREPTPTLGNTAPTRTKEGGISSAIARLKKMRGESN